MKRAIKFILLFSLVWNTSLEAQDFQKTWQTNIDKGKELYAENKYAEALDMFQKASQLIPTDTTAFIYVLDCAFKLQNAELFYKTLDNLRFLKADKEEFYVMSAVIARDAEKDDSKALNFISQGFMLYPKSKELAKEEAILYYKNQNYDKALEKLLRLKSSKPYDYQVYNLILTIKMDINKSYEEALSFTKEAQIAFPDRVYFQEQEANIYLLMQDIEKAQITFERILSQNPKDPKAYYNLALIFFHQGDYATSAEICLKAIDLDPNYLDAIYNVGTFYYYNGLTYNTALSDMDIYQYDEQGDEFEKLAIEFFETAKPYFEKAIKLNPDELDAYENLNTISVLLENLYEIRKIKEKDLQASNTQITSEGSPDLYISDLFFEYPKDGKLKKGQTGYVNFKLENMGNASAKSLQVISITPVIIPGLEYERITDLEEVPAGENKIVKIPIQFATNNAQTQGIEKMEGAENKMRIVVKAAGNIKTEMVEFNINIGDEQITGDVNVVVADTEDIDYFDPEPVARNFLFLIGINEYSEWPALKNAVSDVSKVKDILLEKYDFEPDFVYELYNNNATQQNIRNELIKIKREITPNDNLVMYYAGHGFYDIEFDEGSWIPVDAGYGIETDYMANSRLVKYLNNIVCKHLFIMADACFSGSLFVKDSRISYESKNDKINSRWALSSGNMEEVADGSVGGNSPFAESLIEFLGMNKMKGIPITELISYISFKVKNQTSETTGQTPIGKPLNVEGNKGGEYILYTK